MDIQPQVMIGRVMFKHLPDEVIHVLLGLCNTIWSEGVIPSGRKRAVKLPYVKPGKDPSFMC